MESVRGLEARRRQGHAASGHRSAGKVRVVTQTRMPVVEESLRHLNAALASFETLVDVAAAGRKGLVAQGQGESGQGADAKATPEEELHQRQAADAADVLGDLQLVHEEMKDIALRLGAAAYHWQLHPGASPRG